MTTIDWNIAVVDTLKTGQFPNRDKVKASLQWIDNRLAVTLQHIHGYCFYTKDEVNNNSDLDGVEECMIEIIEAATYVLKETRTLKNKRCGRGRGVQRRWELICLMSDRYVDG